MGGELTESRFDPMTFGSDTMLNYQLSQKLKLIGKGKNKNENKINYKENETKELT
jgi:hypothetical protein